MYWHTIRIATMSRYGTQNFYPISKLYLLFGYVENGKIIRRRKSARNY